MTEPIWVVGEHVPEKSIVHITMDRRKNEFGAGMDALCYADHMTYAVAMGKPFCGYPSLKGRVLRVGMSDDPRWFGPFRRSLQWRYSEDPGPKEDLKNIHYLNLEYLKRVTEMVTALQAKPSSVPLRLVILENYEEMVLPEIQAIHRLGVAVVSLNLEPYGPKKLPADILFQSESSSLTVTVKKSGLRYKTGRTNFPQQIAPKQLAEKTL